MDYKYDISRCFYYFCCQVLLFLNRISPTKIWNNHIGGNCGLATSFPIPIRSRGQSLRAFLINLDPSEFDTHNLLTIPKFQISSQLYNHAVGASYCVSRIIESLIRSKCADVGIDLSLGLYRRPKILNIPNYLRVRRVQSMII